jgi:hypothetical protein
MRRVGADFEIVLKKGQTIEAALPKPARLPPEPAVNRKGA